MSPRFSEVRGRPLTRAEEIAERVAMSSLGYQYLRRVAPTIDRFLIPRTKGRWSSAGKDLVGMVTTTGAKSGLPRSQPLTCIRGENGTLLLVGSNYGQTSTPAWVHNLAAHPDCTVTFRGATRSYRATELTGDERDAAWQRAVDWFGGYAQYDVMSGSREIRLFRLTPT